MAKVKRKINCRGAALLEMAIVLLLLLLLTFGVIEFGWLFLKSQQIANAARNGARVGIRYGATIPDSVTTTIDTLMTSAGMDKAKVGYTVNFPSPPTLPYSNALTVQIVVPCNKIALLNMPGPFWWTLPTNLTASVTMAKEEP